LQPLAHHIPDATQPLPLVTVVCVCYNQGRFVREALFSVKGQTYPNIELIIVDDGSTDDSVARIRDFLAEFPQTAFIPLPTNRGVCAAFNEGFRQSKGAFLIDLAADDVLLPDRVTRQVVVFGQLGDSWGVVFTDAGLIDEASRHLGYFYPREADGSLRKPVPSGDLYRHVLNGYFICTPTMMSRRAVYEALGGYDESLSYEDFDFWVRSSRTYGYFYLDEVLTLKRRVAGSHSTQFYNRRHNPHLASTLVVCRKAYRLNRTSEEHEALARLVRYYLRQALFTENFQLARAYGDLLGETTDLGPADRFLLLLARCRAPLFPLYRLYLRRRFANKQGA
jgi:glycosyltransferase involved in cell wall biosynthesis